MIRTRTAQQMQLAGVHVRRRSPHGVRHHPRCGDCAAQAIVIRAEGRAIERVGKQHLRSGLENRRARARQQQEKSRKEKCMFHGFNSF
jgi:hypothetical protein